jgi:hypothetical protein
VPSRQAPPVVSAVALSTAYLKLGELTRRAFTGGEAFVLEKDRIPLVAIVSAREWMDYLAQRYPTASISVRRSALSAPRARRPLAPSRRRHVASKRRVVARTTSGPGATRRKPGPKPKGKKR